MAVIRSFVTLTLLAATFATASTHDVAWVGKRSPLLDDRQSTTCSTAGWISACPGLFKCVPPGAICCSDTFHYAIPPETCPDGTQPVATASISSAPPSPVTTAPPPPPTTQTIYQEYFFTITWYYYYYFLTYIQIEAATVTTSYQITTEAVLTLSATNSMKASLSFSSLSATIAFPTPTQNATSLSGPPGPAPTSYTPTMLPPTYSTTSLSSTKTKTYVGTTSVGTTSSVATSSAVLFTGSANALYPGRLAKTVGAGWMMGALIVVPGLLMIWL